jgi:hypothetical protein
LDFIYLLIFIFLAAVQLLQTLLPKDITPPEYVSCFQTFVCGSRWITFPDAFVQ